MYFSLREKEVIDSDCFLFGVGRKEDKTVVKATSLALRISQQRINKLVSCLTSIRGLIVSILVAMSPKLL